MLDQTNVLSFRAKGKIPHLVNLYVPLSGRKCRLHQQEKCSPGSGIDGGAGGQGREAAALERRQSGSGPECWLLATPLPVTEMHNCTAEKNDSLCIEPQ